MSKYVANRRDVCAGQLLKPLNISYNIYDDTGKEINENDLAKQGITNFSVSGGIVCRGMLFNVDDDGLANDLIYTTPTNYPIEGIQSKIDVERDFVINHYVELVELLKYLKYGVDLTQNDLNQIYRRFIISDRFLRQHMELFGWKKASVGYTNGGIQTIPMAVYDNLSSISCSSNGKPYREEPGYRRIKKKR